MPFGQPVLHIIREREREREREKERIILYYTRIKRAEREERVLVF